MIQRVPSMALLAALAGATAPAQALMIDNFFNDDGFYVEASTAFGCVADVCDPPPDPTTPDRKAYVEGGQVKASSFISGNPLQQFDGIILGGYRTTYISDITTEADEVQFQAKDFFDSNKKIGYLEFINPAMSKVNSTLSLVWDGTERTIPKSPPYNSPLNDPARPLIPIETNPAGITSGNDLSDNGRSNHFVIALLPYTAAPQGEFLVAGTNFLIQAYSNSGSRCATASVTPSVTTQQVGIRFDDFLPNQIACGHTDSVIDWRNVSALKLQVTGPIGYPLTVTYVSTEGSGDPGIPEIDAMAATGPLTFLAGLLGLAGERRRRMSVTSA